MEKSNRIPVLINGTVPDPNSGGPGKVLSILIQNADIFERNGMRLFISNRNGLFEATDTSLRRATDIITASSNRGARLFVPRFADYITKTTRRQWDSEQRVLKDNILKWSNSYPDGVIASHTNIANNSAIELIERNVIPKYKVCQTYHSKGSIIHDARTRGPKDIEWQITIEKWVMQNSSSISFPSFGAKCLFEQDHNITSSMQTEIIHNGIDCKHIYDIIKNNGSTEINKSPSIINVAAHVKQKNIDVLLRSFKIIREQSDCQLIQVGNGPMTRELHCLAEELGVQNSVRWIEKLDHSRLIEELHNGSVFVAASEKVVFDLVNLEAMASGTPVVLTDDGGNKECVIDGQHGLLSPIDPPSIAERVLHLLNNRHIAETMADNARSRVEREFSSETMTRKYVEFYGR